MGLFLQQDCINDLKSMCSDIWEILTGKNYVLLNLLQEFISIQAWLLLTFFICLHNKLNSTHSIVTHINPNLKNRKSCYPGILQHSV